MQQSRISMLSDEKPRASFNPLVGNFRLLRLSHRAFQKAEIDWSGTRHTLRSRSFSSQTYFGRTFPNWSEAQSFHRARIPKNTVNDCNISNLNRFLGCTWHSHGYYGKCNEPRRQRISFLSTHNSFLRGLKFCNSANSSTTTEKSSICPKPFRGLADR
jgi:hypothetical protein